MNRRRRSRKYDEGENFDLELKEEIKALLTEL